MSAFRINTEEIVKSGPEQIVFDPEKVSITSHIRGEVLGWAKEKRTAIRFEYDDSDLSAKMHDLSYSNGWNNTKVENGFNGFERKGKLLIKCSVHTSLRKKKGKTDEYTDKSHALHDEVVEKRLKGINIEWARLQFKESVEGFNKYYLKEQKRKIMDWLGKVNTWNFNSEKEVLEIEEELKDLMEKEKELNDKLHNLKCKKIIEFIKEDSGINDCFKSGLKEHFEGKMKEGYVSNCLFF